MNQEKFNDKNRSYNWNLPKYQPTPENPFPELPPKQRTTKWRKYKNEHGEWVFVLRDQNKDLPKPYFYKK